MFFIRKYADCWAVHNDDTGESRKLTEQEQKAVQEEFPSLQAHRRRSMDTFALHDPHDRFKG